LSGVGTLLRVTVAVPVRVATLPIGSLTGAWPGSCAGGDGAGATIGGAGVGAGWVCANCIAPEIACGASDTGEDTAHPFADPASARQQTSPIANESRFRIKIVPRARKELANAEAIEGLAG
jgi:hypothetical protein